MKGRCRPPAAPGRRGGSAGSSLLEVVAGAAVAAIVGAAAVPPLAAQRDEIHAAGAARHMASLVRLARAESLRRGVHAAVAFQPSGQDYRFAIFADGNYDGVRTADIGAGIDRQVSSWARIGDQFPRAAFGIVPGVPDPDSGTRLTGSPVKLGGSNLLSFGPDGGATSGTLYLRGPAGQQYAVRILGATGRSRLLRFDFGAGRWESP